jgi:hypothetical protein
MKFPRCPRCDKPWLVEQYGPEYVCVGCNFLSYAENLIWAFNGLEIVDGNYVATKECLCWWFSFPKPGDPGICRLFSGGHDEPYIDLPLLPLKITKEELDKLLVLI